MIIQKRSILFFLACICFAVQLAVSQSVPTDLAGKKVFDKRSQFLMLSQKTQLNPESKSAFLASRMGKLYDLPTRPENLMQLRNFFADSALLGSDCSGRVAHGSVLEAVPRADFVWSTTFDGSVTIPASRGGQIIASHCPQYRHLFLVTNNQAVRNTEAYVSYDSEAIAPQFVIFDWSIPNWALVINYLDLDDYITNHSTTLDTYPIMRIHNATGDDGNGIWTNRVYLFNWKNDAFDLVYSRSYESTLNEQRGPSSTKPLAFIETRWNLTQHNAQSQPLGFFGIYYGSGIVESGVPTWVWRTPDTSNSHIRRDDYGTFTSPADTYPTDGMGFQEILGEKIPNRQFIVE